MPAAKAGFPNRTNGPEPAKSAFGLWATSEGDLAWPSIYLPRGR
jgi:hypothetical protein